MNKTLETKLQSLYENLGAKDEDDFVLASHNAEAVNSVILSNYFDGVREHGRNHFISTEVEGKAALLSIQRLEALGCVGKIVPVNKQGQLSLDVLEEALRPRVALVSISWANPFTGVVQPIEDIARLCKEKGVALHVDATEVIGKVYFRFQDLEIDFLSFDRGLFIKAGRPFSPFILGAPEPDSESLTKLSDKIERAIHNFDHVGTESARLRDRFEKKITAQFPGAISLFAQSERLPDRTIISFPGVVAEALHYLLGRKGIKAHLGDLPSVLKLCGFEPLLCQSALSFAISSEAEESGVDAAAEIVIACAKQLRSYSQELLK